MRRARCRLSPAPLVAAAVRVRADVRPRRHTARKNELIQNPVELGKAGAVIGLSRQADISPIFVGATVTEEAGPWVLYVEDEALIQELGITALEEAGFCVSAHLSGADAVEALGNDGLSFRALVTDIDLSGQPNGWDLARLARERLPDLPVIYVSGGSSHEWTSRGVPGSVLVAKPYAAAQLVVAVSNAMLGPQTPAVGAD